MREEFREAEESFYARCAELLGAPHEYRAWTGRGPNRWNNRKPGNGRFPGFGLIQMYSPNCIRIAIHTPRRINRMVKSVDEAYAALVG